jgi:hypothetical protein
MELQFLIHLPIEPHAADQGPESPTKSLEHGGLAVSLPETDD